MSSGLPVLPPEAITAEWLTKALAGRGIEARVARFDMETVGTGQLGETRRFHLHYAGAPAPEAPQTVVGKFSSANPVAAESGRTMGFYRAEVMFYRELAHKARARTPLPYVAEIDEEGDFALLFEDLAPAQTGDQFRGCTPDEARAALKEAAMLHATFWNDEALMQQRWLYVPEGAQGFYTTELIERSWDHVQKNYQGWLSPEVTACCDRFVRNHAFWNRPRPFPKTFTHCDFRPDNMLFGGPDGRVALVDWQTSNFLGTGMDVAYFLGGCFDRETRRKHERDLLKGYHDDLLALGVKDYSFDHLLDDYRHYSYAVIAVAIAATLIVKRTDRGDRMLMHMTIGGAEQAIDNAALDLLPP
jgi:predicted RNase H-like HicB family nuclease